MEENKKKKNQKAKKKKKTMPVKITKNKEELLEIRKKRHIIEIVIIAIILLFMLILLVNKTFFKEEYTTDKIDINIPMLSYFVSDNGHEIKFLSLRKSEYLKKYFDNYLSNFTHYNCENTSFYYNEITNTAIYKISVEKTIAIKTIKILYENGDANNLCK